MRKAVFFAVKTLQHCHKLIIEPVLKPVLKPAVCDNVTGLIITE
jgi:hypothetical protein